MKPVKKFPVLLIVSVVLCALGYVLRPLMPGLADMFRHLGFIWIGYGVFALLLKQPKETRARTVCSLTRSILSYTAVLLSVFFGLRALGVDVTASLASVGVVTLIIGFGAQSLIEDVLTGIFLIAEGRYNVGDILVLDDFRGKVVDISVRTTTLEDSGGNHKIINNSEIRNFQNRSQETSVAVSTISIGYDADLRAVEAVITDALPAMYEENRGVFLDVPQYIGVEELAGSGVVLKFIVSATEENIFAARRALNRSLKLLFDEKGIGNGISLIIFAGIVSRIPAGTVYLFNYAQGGGMHVLHILGFLVIALISIVATIAINEGQRRIPVQYAKRVVGRKVYGGQSTHIPIKVNSAGVIPVIFASSLMSFPVVIAGFFQVNYDTIGGKILLALNSSSWFNPERPAYSVGLIVYIALIIVFAYFYTSITFNPLEVANNMKKSGGFIPGIRPGKPTSDYLDGILEYIILIGACGLIIVCLVPIIVSGLFSVSRLSFGGTSLIIIVGVVLETIKAVESQMLVRNYKGFLND